MRVTVQELREKHNGKLPPGWTLWDGKSCPEDDEGAYSPQKPTRAKPERRTRAGRFALLNAFVDFTMAKLTGSEVAVWMILFRDSKKSGIARTGQTDIAKRAGITDRMVRRALDSLQTKGLLDCVRRGRLGSGPSAYRVWAVPGERP